MNNRQNGQNKPVERSGAESPVWWIVCKWELADLWIGGRVLMLLILFSVLMSITSVLREMESQLSMIPPAEIVFIILQSTITFGLFIGLIIGADSISGERERATFETLLLTPTSRRQIVLGKFLAALSPWPVAMALSIPYMAALSQGDAVLGPALLWGAIMGTVLAVAFTGFGLLVSIWSNSNRISLFVSLLVYILLLIPTLWPGAAQKGDLGYLLQQLNPMQGTSEFLEKILVNNRTVAEKATYTFAALLSAVVVVGLLFLYAAPNLRLDGGAPRLSLRPRRATVAGALLMICLTAALSSALPLHAAAATGAEQPLQISVDLDHKTIAAGDQIEFKTVVTNNGAQASPAFHVSMNIIKIGSGDPVDPEDWAPERSQEIEPLEAGQSAEQAWVVHGILEGNYMVYMTVIPTPDGPDTTTQTVSSMGIHVIVKASNHTNPGGVLPIALGIPVVLTSGTLLLRWRRRSGSPTDDSESVE